MKRILALFLILIITMGLFGCAKAPEDVGTDVPDAPSTKQTEPEPEPITVAVCMGSINHPVHRIVQTGFMLKAEELGMNGVISGLDNGSMTDHIDKWNRDILNNNVVGALIWTGDDTCYEMMKDLKEQGVHTVVAHFMHGYKYAKDIIDKNICANPWTYVPTVADYIVARLEERNITEGTICVTGNGGSVYPADYTIFSQYIEEFYPAFTVPVFHYEGLDTDVAIDRMTNITYEYPDLVAVFGITDLSAQIWSEAMENTGRTDLIVVGMHYTELNIELVSNEQITAIVCQPLYEEAEACAQALYDLNNGAVFNTSEDTWFEELEAPIATKEDMPYYRDIWQKMYDYFGEE